MRTLSNGVPPGVVIPPGRFRMPSFGHGPATRFRRGSSAVCSVIIPPRPSPPSTASVVIARAWSTACGCQNLSASSLNVKSDESCDENVHCTPEPLWWNDWRGDKARRAGGGGDGAAFRRETAVVSLCREGKQTPFRAHRARAIRPSRRSVPQGPATSSIARCSVRARTRNNNYSDTDIKGDNEQTQQHERDARAAAHPDGRELARGDEVVRRRPDRDGGDVVVPGRWFREDGVAREEGTRGRRTQRDE